MHIEFFYLSIISIVFSFLCSLLQKLHPLYSLRKKIRYFHEICV